MSKTVNLFEINIIVNIFKIDIFVINSYMLSELVYIFVSYEFKSIQFFLTKTLLFLFFLKHICFNFVLLREIKRVLPLFIGVLLYLEVIAFSFPTITNKFGANITLKTVFYTLQN